MSVDNNDEISQQIGTLDNNPIMRVCKKCNAHLPLSSCFHVVKRLNAKIYYSHVCRSCTTEKRKGYMVNYHKKSYKSTKKSAKKGAPVDSPRDQVPEQVLDAPAEQVPEQVPEQVAPEETLEQALEQLIEQEIAAQVIELVSVC
jgi:RNase P subunit RPR2